MSDYSVDVKKILVQNGCLKIRSGKGDHEIWMSPINGKHITVDSKIKSRHTANEVLKQAGIEKQF